MVVELIGFKAMITNPLTKGLAPKGFKDHVIKMGTVYCFDFFC